MTGVRTGIQTGNYYNANPGTTGSISNNQIGVWRLGIFHNLAYGSASPFTISDNTITAENLPGRNQVEWYVAQLHRRRGQCHYQRQQHRHPGRMSFAPPGYTAGYNVWN